MGVMLSPSVQGVKLSVHTQSFNFFNAEFTNTLLTIGTYSWQLQEHIYIGYNILVTSVVSWCHKAYLQAEVKPLGCQAMGDKLHQGAESKEPAGLYPLSLIQRSGLCCRKHPGRQCSLPVAVLCSSAVVHQAKDVVKQAVS